MNPDDYESLPTTSVAINMSAGAIAGVLEHCIMYPLDSVKTRMQSLSTVSFSIASTLRNMITTEGLSRPIRGITAVVAGAGPAHALYFGSYELTKEMLTNVTSYSQVNYVASGVVATLIHDAVSNPTEVIKQRMQMYNSKYKSVITCMIDVYRREGFKAFYRSYATQLVMNIPYQAVQFNTYEFFQNRLNHERKYNPQVHVIAGGAAGACAAAITTPLDVMKTLLNTQETGFTKGMKEAFKQIHSMAGPSGFFRGITARILYSMPATAICWSTYEFFKFYLCGMEHDTYKSSITGKSELKPRDSTSALLPSGIMPDRALMQAQTDVDKVPYVLPGATTTTTADEKNSKTTASHTSNTSNTSTTSTQHTQQQQSTGGPLTGPIKSVCDLPTTVTGPTLNLHTRHSEVKSPFDRGFSRS